MIQWGRCVVWGGGRKIVIGNGRVELALGSQFWVLWENDPKLFRPWRSSGIGKHTHTHLLQVYMATDYTMLFCHHGTYFPLLPSLWTTLIQTMKIYDLPFSPLPLCSRHPIHTSCAICHTWLQDECECLFLSISPSSLLIMGFRGQKALLLHLNILSVWHVVNTWWMLNEWLKLVSNSSWNLNEH